MHRLQVPLDGTQGESSLFPQGCYQAEQVDTQPLFPQDHPGQVRLRCPGPLTYWASPGDEDVLGDFYRNHWDINDLSGPLRPAPSQTGTALGAGRSQMLDPVGGRHARAGEAVGPGLPWAVLARWPLACGGFDAGHPAGTTGLGLSFQNFNPPLQLGDDRLLLGDDRLQDFPGSAAQIHIGIHTIYLT